MAELKEQTNLIKDVLEFNKKTTILGILPSGEELKTVRAKCAAIEVYKFNLDVSDIDLIKQIAKFADTY